MSEVEKEIRKTVALLRKHDPDKSYLCDLFDKLLMEKADLLEWLKVCRNRVTGVILSKALTKVIDQYDYNINEDKEMYYFRKKGVQPMQPWSEETDMDGVSVSTEDAANGSPQKGDWIAVSPKNPDDRWLIAEAYHTEHYEEAP